MNFAEELLKSFFSRVPRPGSSSSHQNKEDDDTIEVPQTADQEDDPFRDIRKYMEPWENGSVMEKFHNKLDEFLKQYQNGWMNFGTFDSNQHRNEPSEAPGKEGNYSPDEYGRFLEDFGMNPSKESPSYFPKHWQGIIEPDTSPRSFAGENVDREIDSSQARSVLDKMFRKREAAPSGSLVERAPGRRQLRSISQSTIVRPGGVVEERRRSVDTDGNEVDTVTRTIGDKKHTVVTETNLNGTVETKEDMVNIEISDLDGFNENFQEHFVPTYHHPPTYFGGDFRNGKSLDDRETIFERFFKSNH